MLTAYIPRAGSWNSIAENPYGSTNATVSALPYVIAPGSTPG